MNRISIYLSIPIICLFWLIVLTLVACNASLPLPVATPTAASITPNPDPSPTGLPREDTSPPTPVQSPTSPGPTRIPTPVADLQDLSLYQTALRPEFAADVEAVPDATRYFIQATLIPGELPTLTGVERVRYTNTEDVPLEALYFRLYPNLPGYGGTMRVEQVVLNGAPVEAVLEAADSAIRVPLDPALNPGAVVDLTLWFQDVLPTSTSAGYGLFAFADGVYALAGFYPTIPVYDDEGWNVEVAPPYGDATFTDASFYQVHLTAPADLVVVTSGSTLETQDNGDGTHTWVAVGGPMRDFYVAMSADYRVESEQVDGTLVNSYYRSAGAEGGERALQYAADALRLFSEEFGPYPYAELDVVATPTNAGGIEYPGAIVVAQGLYSETSGFFQLATVHEVAHQWWYGLVGNDQLDEPWLDESLTNYSAYLYYEETAGPARADVIKERVFEGPYRAIQNEGRDRGVGGPVASFSESDYGAIVYGKGPLFFDAVRDELGKEAFLAGLQTYLQAHRYGVAYPDDLIAAFDDTSGQKIDGLYDFWILGQTK